MLVYKRSDSSVHYVLRDARRWRRMTPAEVRRYEATGQIPTDWVSASLVVAYGVVAALLMLLGLLH